MLNHEIFTNHKSCSEVGRRAILLLHLDLQIFSKFHFTDRTKFNEEQLCPIYHILLEMYFEIGHGKEKMENKLYQYALEVTN